MNDSLGTAERQTRIPVATVDAEYTIEDALVHVGHGWMQRWLFVVLGASYATYSANVVLMSFLEPNVKCDWNLDKTEETALSVAVLLGMIVGSNLWGTIADVYGRKWGVALPLVVEGVAGMIASVAGNYTMLLVCRGVVGIGVGGLATSFSTYSEFLPTGTRGYHLCWYQMFWASGGIFEVVAAWMIVPRYDWRALTFVTALPARESLHHSGWDQWECFSVVLLPAIALLPESPRYLAVTGHSERALGVLERIARVNSASLPPGRIKVHRGADAVHSSRETLCKQLSSLFAPSLRMVTPIVWFLSFALGVGYYAMIILTATVRTDDSDETCRGKKSDVADSDYVSILVDALAELPGVILALFTIERLGRIRSMLLSWCACWMSMGLLILFPAEKTMFLFVARLFTAFTDIFIFVLTPELYPSSCRCLAVGIMSAVSQVGGAIAPFIARAAFHAYGLTAVSCICGSLFLMADIVTFFLIPFETSGTAMRDDLSEFHNSGTGAADFEQPFLND